MPAVNQKLMALAGPSGPAPFPAPPSKAPAEEADKASASLAQLAMGFKEATDPRDAAAFLLEFLEQAGVTKR